MGIVAAYVGDSTNKKMLLKLNSKPKYRTGGQDPSPWSRPSNPHSPGPSADFRRRHAISRPVSRHDDDTVGFLAQIDEMDDKVVRVDSRNDILQLRLIILVTT